MADIAANPADIDVHARRPWQSPAIITALTDETAGPTAYNTDEKPFDDFGS